MRRTRRKSRNYRGTQRGGIGVLIPVLIVLCVVAAGVLYFVNENMIFTKNGSFFSAPKKEKSVPEVETNLVIESEGEAPPEKSEPIQEVESPEEDGGTRAYFIPIGSVKSTELFDAAISGIPTDKDINKIVLEVKAEDGTLAFAADSKIAENAAVSGDDAVLTDVIAKVKEKGFKVALYMSCFKDNEAARKNQAYAARTQNKIIWLDGYNTRWLSAYSDSAQQYLTDIIKKLAGFNPDEIILSNISFPAVGKTEIISYDETLGTKQEMLQSFIEEAKTAAGEIPLSAVYENYNAKCRSESGQDAADFGASFEAVYINETAGRYTLGLDDAKTLFETADCTVVPISAESSGTEFMIKK